jgi:hypothetical protein
MALITRRSGVTVDTISAAHAAQIPASLGLVAGEALDAAAPCYIKAADNKVYMSNGTSANEAAEVDGFTGKSYTSGEPVTLFGEGVIFEYAASGLTPGAVYYVGATAGRLDDGTTTGDSVGVARSINATHIRVTRAK